MNNMLPNLPPGETEHTFRLLSLIADPEASRKRLTELAAQEQAAAQRHEDAVKAEQAANIAADNAKRAKDDADRKLVELNEEHARKAKVLSEREVNLNNREIDLSAKEKDLSQRENALAQGLSDVRAREASVSLQEQVAQSNRADLQKTQDMWKAKFEAVHAALKEHLSGII